MTREDLSLDRLADRVGDRGGPLQVLELEDLRVGSAADPVREPHRHDYHELLWVRAGSGEHLLDGERFALRPGTVTLIGRGQVHTMRRSEALSASVIRFGDELLSGRTAWLLAGRGGRTVPVPDGEAPVLAGAFDGLAAETRRPADERTPRVEHHLLTTILLWVERWHDASRAEERPDTRTDLLRRFQLRLEEDFARHHDATHYADALAVPAAALSKSLAEATGRTTKELITERVMLEATRLLRYTDRTVGEIAFAAGFGDPLYFSRAFKRHVGEPPMAYRARVRGIPS